ncbi:diaminopimelate epimerase [Algimonas porphyrae]|uniref:Diaminopimelate epimerase n=1 Tax=Algimonas porphyrae TaxID=1128113 RepID=A0ABQ5V1A3_9PROT|nr:diaminopimelate epimerase [Algimonas porphyrae]GLQ20573.1 diaminopimelate epimerase [Algimonas porphyrae]
MNFLIMNGAGNRFAIFDARDLPDFALSDEQVRGISEPGSAAMGPLGADQLIILRKPTSPDADIFMEIRNQKGFEVDACGNATRCAAWLVMEETGDDEAVVQTNDALLSCTRAGPQSVAVDMGEPKLDWSQIPLKEPMHTHHVDVKLGPIDAPVLSNPGAVSMGNPHVVFFVDDFDTVKPHLAGPMVEFHPLFPEQTNVGFARVEGPDRMRLKVWERGVGMTLACGTGACAAVVAAHRQKRMGRKVSVVVDGGVLEIDWRTADNHVIMTGPVELERRGTL